MTTVRRSKAMPTDGPTAKFLYTIIKQLDLKCIDWNLVASQLEISNGHAARMRYSRFRQQMEGITSTPRAPRAKKQATKSAKTGLIASKADMQKEVSPQPPQMIKQEPSLGVASPSNTYIKTEPYAQPIPNLADIPHVSSPHDPLSPCPQLAMASFPQISVGPTELAIYAPVQGYASSSIGFDHTHGSHLGWAPIKTEPRLESEYQRGVNGVSVKTEGVQQEDEEMIS